MAVQTAIFPPPVDGLNLQSSLASMLPTEAIILDNWIVEDGGIVSRRGMVNHSTGQSAPIQSLLTYAPSNGSEQAIAATTTALWNADAIPIVSLKTGFSSGKWQGTMIATVGGHFLMLCNPHPNDFMQRYDGTSMTDVTLTGMSGSGTSKDITYICSYGQRLFMARRNSAIITYLPVNTISGAVSELDYTSFFDLGGYVQAIATWTRDGGSGIDDLIAFISSEGQVLMYSGTNPASATEWSKVGLFRIAKPIGRNCIIKMGSDVGVLTIAGVVRLSQALAGEFLKTETDKISPVFAPTQSTSFDDTGWYIADCPSDSLRILGTRKPGDLDAKQYVQNVKTGKWSSWSIGMLNCVTVTNQNILFGLSNGSVVRYEAQTDTGSPIGMALQTAFSNLGTETNKLFSLCAPYIQGSIVYEPPIQIRTDYDVSELDLPLPTTVDETTPWGSPWGSPWSAPVRAIEYLIAAPAEGKVASFAMRLASKTRVRFNRALAYFQSGGDL